MDYLNQILFRLEMLVGTDTSVSAAGTGGGNELPLAIFLRDEFRKYGIPAIVYESTANRGSLYAVIEGRHPEKVLIHTHLDTAQPGKGSPCRLIKKDNRYFGRGTLDCKGPIAVWVQVISDLYRQNGRPERTIAFAAVADEENGGQYGTEWLWNHTNCFDSAFLVIGEGGGYAVPFEDAACLTFQTGEIEEREQEETEIEPVQLIQAAIQKGFYNQTTLRYYRENSFSPNSRCVAKESFTDGIRSYIAVRQETAVLRKYLPVFEQVLQEFQPDYTLLPVISPGYSDNRFFRQRKIDTIGFFPLHPDNAVRGIHQDYEYISKNSIEFSYQYFLKLLARILY